MNLPKLEGLNKQDQLRFEHCVDELVNIVDSHFPELRKIYEDFESRIFMTLYLEMIHMGFFKIIQEK